LTSGRRGCKTLSSRDWLFGSRPRRLALEALFAAQSDKRWSKAELARAAQVSANGGIDEHVDGFERIGLLQPDGRGYVLRKPPPAFADELSRLLAALRDVADTR
jgi:hypothetical protein